MHAIARQLDAGTARELALGQLDRARRARLADREHRAVADVRPETPDAEAGEQALLADFGTSRDALVGAGGESEVFALDEHRVLRLYRSTHEGPELVVGQLQHLYGVWRGAATGLQLPEVLQAGHAHGRFSTVDRRFAGGSLSAWLPTADAADRRTAMLSLLDAAEGVSRLPLVVPGFARLVGLDAPRSYGSLTELLSAMLAGPTGRSREQLTRDLPDVAGVWDRLHRELAEREVSPAVVHGDLAPGNVYVSVGAAGEADAGPRVSGVGDFSPHTLQADPLMDLTGAVAFLELEQYPGAAADSAWLLGAAADRYGPGIAHWVGVYRRYFGFYFSDTCAFDPTSYAWCLRQLDAG